MNDNRDQTPPLAARWRISRGCALVLGAWSCLSLLAGSSASASVIVQDDFNGAAGPPDPAKWSAAPASDYLVGLASFFPPTQTGTGYVLVDTAQSPAGNAKVLVALPAFLTAPSSRALRMTITATNIVNHMSMGLLNNASDTIIVSDDTAGLAGLTAVGGLPLGTVGTEGDWIVLMHTSAGYQETSTGVSAATGAAGTWVFNWAPNDVTLSFDNVLAVDTAAAGPAAGGPTWIIPTAAMVPVAYVYGGSSGLVDSLTFETIPEPSTMLLLGVGGLLIGKQWKRQRRGA